MVVLLFVTPNVLQFLWAGLLSAAFCWLAIASPWFVLQHIYSLGIVKLFSVVWLSGVTFLLFNEGQDKVWTHRSWWPQMNERVRRNNQLARWRAFAVLCIYNVLFKIPVLMLLFLFDTEVCGRNQPDRQYWAYTCVRAKDIFSQFITYVDPLDSSRSLRRFNDAVEQQSWHADMASQGLTAASTTTSDELVRSADGPRFEVVVDDNYASPTDVHAFAVLTPEAFWRTHLLLWRFIIKDNYNPAPYTHSFFYALLFFFIFWAGLLWKSGNSPLVLVLAVVLYCNNPYEKKRLADELAQRTHAHAE